MPAFSIGYAAYLAGETRNHNPYDYNNDFINWRSWDNGWEFGKSNYLFGE
jgi:hypothetical protein